MARENIWVVDDDDSIRWVLQKAFTRAGWAPRCFDAPESLLAALERRRPDVIISDIKMPGMDGITLLETLKQRAPELPTIIITAYSDLDRTVSAFQEGAYEYLSKPFDVDEIVALVRRVLNEKRRPESGAAPVPYASEIVGSATAMQEVFRAVARLSNSHLSVLITGESGTGKELVAKAVHTHSPRSEKPFIALNTAATPHELLESEFFGHEKGAFTGAVARRAGRFEQADGGALFLDEIGDMPADLQTHLLRVLATGEFYRVGGHTPIKVDVRIIAATHQNIEQRVRDGAFREDLLHRLNVIRVHVPPLRERPEDIPALLDHFLHRAAEELQTPVKIISAETRRFLIQAPWPGNVRQLENFCRWITVMVPGTNIQLDDLPPELRGGDRTPQAESWEKGLQRWADQNIAAGGALARVVPTVERILIKAALSETRGKRQNAAKLLGWGRNTLSRKIKELGLD